MSYADGDRVVLQRDRRPHGKVVGKEFNGLAYVRLDNGQAASFKVEELAFEEAAAETKSWPPNTETK